MRATLPTIQNGFEEALNEYASRPKAKLKITAGRRPYEFTCDGQVLHWYIVISTIENREGNAGNAVAVACATKMSSLA